MGSYLNPGSKGFQESLNSEIYVDKTGLIEKTNAVLDTRQKFLCVSRPRRFGKSIAGIGGSGKFSLTPSPTTFYPPIEEKEK